MDAQLTNNLYGLIQMLKNVITSLREPRLISQQYVEVGEDWELTDSNANAVDNVRALRADISDAEVLARSCSGIPALDPLLRSVRGTLRLAYATFIHTRVFDEITARENTASALLPICQQAVERVAECTLPRLVEVYTELAILIEDRQAGLLRKDAGETEHGGRGLRQVDVARGLGVERYEVHRLISQGKLQTNGQSGHACRIEAESVLAYCERAGIAWNYT